MDGWLNLRGYGRSALACVAAVSLMITAAPAHSDEEGIGPKKKKTETREVLARESGGQVEIKGWATFSGQHLASKDDPEDDGATGAEAAGAEAIGADFIYRPENEDFFFRFEMTKIPPGAAGLGGIGPPGVTTTLYRLKFTAKEVPYEIRAISLGGVNVDDPTGASFGLFKCDEAACLEVAPLKGGYGTTGERIVVALPLQVLRDDGTNIKEGDKIGDLLADTSFGSYLGGASDVIFDEIRLSKDPTVTVPEKSVTVTVGKKKVKATPKEGYFSASFPASLFRKATTTVKTRTCLGTECVNQKFKVKN